VSAQVQAPGLLSSLQDNGRQGFQHLGIGPGGAMDGLSHRLANLLLGNPAGAATLEITLAGPTLRFEREALVALAGADLSATVDGQPLPLWRPLRLRAGASLRFGAPRSGARVYLAVAGGWQAEPVLGSRSTHLAAGFGGFQGRALRAGDRLPFPAQPAGPLPLAPGAPFASPPWFLPWFRELDLTRPASLRLIPGPQWPELTEAARAVLLDHRLRVAGRSDRMGLRLEGAALALIETRERISAPVAMGTLQLPPDGAPILLMADRQTTGGYPRLGEVAGVDLAAAAQLRAGDRLGFRLVTARLARELLLAREQRLAELAEAVKARLQEAKWEMISG
jgi:antagonist of KipI